MASTAPQNLPLLYKDLIPISQQEHATWRYNQAEGLPMLHTEHAIPITIDEFATSQRFFPIIFSTGDSPVPLALMGLNEGVNTYFDAAGKMSETAYVPAYVRRYPFLLAKLRPDTDELSLCIDPSMGGISADGKGDPIFDGDQPSVATKALLEFCEQFEQAGQRTAAFTEELKTHDLLMEGEVSIQPDNATTPAVYRGFQMVSEEKLRDLRGDTLRKMNQSGLLPLVHAHLFSLQLMREIFARQVAQGKAPELPPA